MFAHCNAETFDEAEWILVGLPFDIGSLSKIKQYQEGPEVIRDASYGVFDPIFGDLSQKKIFDYGDLDIESYNLYELYDKIEQELNKMVVENKKYVFLGGDHSVTYPIIRTLGKIHGDFYLLYFDAHPDMQPDDYINYQSFILYLIKGNVIKPSNIIMIGVNNWSKDEKKLLNEYNITYYTPFDVWDDPNKIAEETKEKLNRKKVYISIDMDVFGEHGHWVEPFGITPYHFFKIIKDLDINLIGFDVVELFPSEKSENLAAKIIIELIGIF